MTQQCESSPRDTDERNPAGADRQRVLIADDDDISAQILANLLGDLCDCMICSSGQEAIDAIASYNPDLVLLDVEMPGMDGFSACNRIKEDETVRSIPVMFITAHNDPENETRAFECGAVDFISKPFNQIAVRARVNTHLTLKRRNDELQKLAGIDSLTKLANRRTLDDILAKEWRKALRDPAPLSLLMVDIDYFKYYNDAYGHVAGDEVLRKIATVLSEAARRPFDLAARYGGEEFSVLLPGTSIYDARMIAQRIVDRIAELAIPHGYSPVDERVTVSIGVGAIIPSNFDEASQQCRVCGVEAECAARDSNAIFEMADQALYRAKHEGRNRICSIGCELPPPPGQ